MLLQDTCRYECLKEGRLRQSLIDEFQHASLRRLQLASDTLRIADEQPPIPLQ
jgi:hypothetical protein